jgi:4-hydroxy-3-methylbut-2-enyl diphosphate reductase
MGNIYLAKSAGFCFGVERAVKMVSDQIENRTSMDERIYTYGPIIHNDTVVSDFEKRGAHVISEEDMATVENGTVVIRSHGVTKQTIDDLEACGHKIVDATCPFVKKIHKIVAKYSEDGYKILIIGNEKHPEVQGIIGWIKPGTEYIVIGNEEDAESLHFSKGEKVCLVSQTTFNHNKFQELVEIINEKGYDMFAMSTICNATELRQKEAAEIAAQVDVMLVIGDKNSSNSRKLFEICSNKCDNTFFIQTADDLDLSVLQSIHNIGITAGASTPQKIIEEVQKKCQQKILNKC